VTEIREAARIFYDSELLWSEAPRDDGSGANRLLQRRFRSIAQKTGAILQTRKRLLSCAL
jgi:hypothetical protein